MRPVFSLLTIFLGAALLPQVLSQHRVEFKNGDRLSGRMESIQGSETVFWIHPDAVDPIELLPSYLGRIVLQEGAATPLTPEMTQLHLSNGDQLFGELIEVNGQECVLKTPYAGTLKIPRNTLAGFAPMISSGLIFQGPTSLEGWTQGRVNLNPVGQIEAGEWTYKDQAFYATKSASIARDLQLPDVASLSFDLAWRGYFTVAIALYTDSLHPVALLNKEAEPDFGAFYSLQLNTFSANLLPVKKNEPIRYLGQVPLQGMTQKKSAHFEIRLNKAKKIIALFLDGVMVKQWSDPEGFSGKGTAVRFVHQGQGSVRLSNIRVSQWDGLYEEAKPTPATLKQDLARLRNGDKVHGLFQQLQDGKLTFSIPERQFEFPMERLKELVLAPKEAPPLASSTHVRAHLFQGGRLTIQIEQWNRDGVLAISPIFGKAKFRPDAFSLIEFEPAQTRNALQ
ncbi:MAG: hypothetical protein SFY81_17045 [Verrucomicrobiota bacterium]|nr:hypothetical protein [Verrucomicrobiota bacterium]